MDHLKVAPDLASVCHGSGAEPFLVCPSAAGPDYTSLPD